MRKHAKSDIDELAHHGAGNVCDGARLEGLAEPGGIAVSDAVHGAVRGKVRASFVDQGEQRMKNIAQPMHAFAVRPTNGFDGQPSTNVGELGPRLPDKPSIAVLPFTNMSGDPEQEYFADGVVEEIITGLSRFSSLFVIARNSSFTYKGHAIDVRQIGRMPRQTLRAYDLAMQSISFCRRGEYTNDRSLIEKALELANDAISVDAASVPASYALAEALSELAERSRLRGDKPVLLDRAAAVAETLRDLDPTSHAGYYLIGHAAIRRQHAAEALSNLRPAHELNPNDCRALQYLAWAEFNLGLSSLAMEHAELSLRLSPRDPQRYLSYWVLAFAAFVAGSPKVGTQWARKAIEENATFFHGHGVLAACLAESGHLEAAQSEIAFLLAHDPIYIRGRLAGHNYFGLPELGERFTSALRKAAGRLLAEIEAPE